MMESIKFCVLMTISKLLSAAVTVFIFGGILSIISLFAWPVDWVDMHVGREYWEYIIGCIIGIIFTLIAAKLSLCCFRAALIIGDQAIVVQKKHGKKQGE